MTKKEKFLFGTAVIFLLLGAALQFIFTAVKFTGFLLWCAAGVITFYALLDRRSRSAPWARWGKRTLLALLAAGFLFFAVLEIRVLSQARTDEEAPAAAVVVLGAGVNGTVPSLSLRVRLDAALDYAQAHPEIPIVLTGGQGPGEDITEARCMADWLMARGVPEERLLLEEQATTTAENVAFSKAMLWEAGVDPAGGVAVVSSDYHLCRAALLWGDGMVPVAARMPEVYWPLTVNYFIREAFALAAELVF